MTPCHVLQFDVFATFINALFETHTVNAYIIIGFHELVNELYVPQARLVLALFCDPLSAVC